MQIFSDKKFSNPIETIEAFDSIGFKKAFARIEELKKTHYLLGYIRYEAKEVFEGKDVCSKFPFLYFEVFEKFEEYKPSVKNDYVKIVAKPQITFEQYKKAIDEIRENISEGNTYQVNYTCDYKVESEDLGLRLYEYILDKQRTPYNAFICNKYEEVLSFSPELFFEIEGTNIKTKPMKGTVKRGADISEDLKNIEFLKNDIKNRAENVMIVDLLRNDLGKIAKTGSVVVDRLFEIETHKTVHQMTSEVSAKLPEKISLFKVFEALFPCGSITGAPKVNTMKIIDELEIGNREVYCGAIGLISPERTVFSVPIRILQRKIDEEFYKCRVGGGIVWDSTAEDEWDEVKTKIKFLEPDFCLLETMLVENSKIKLEKEHLERLKKSALELGFIFDSEKFKPDKSKDGILRILLSKDGSINQEIKPLDAVKTNKVKISDVVLDSDNVYLRHKTTFRPWYEKTFEKIKSAEVFDELFFNDKGELCEGARSNIVLEIDEKLYTPCISSGFLNGIKRQQMLSDLVEKKLYLKDLKAAQKIYCVNSVRGVVEVNCDFD